MSYMSKLDQIRALREARYKEQFSRTTPPEIPSSIIDEFERTHPNVTVGVPVSDKQAKQNAAKRAKRGRPRKTEEGFDKTAWQRDYMRKRRASAKQE